MEALSATLSTKEATGAHLTGALGQGVLTLPKTHLKVGYINTRTPLNAKLKGIVLNFQTTFRTKKANKRHHLIGT